MGTLHAIKTLNADHADDPVARRLLLQEATIGLSLHHPHLVAAQILLRLEDGRPALVMEWCTSSLADRLSNGPLQLNDILLLTRSLLEGLSAVHAHSIVHCDLSPDNILFADDGVESLRIADFGIALQSGHRHAELDIRFAGQAHFSAPEQKDGGPVDARTDLYAVGKILSPARRLRWRCSHSPSPSRLPAFATRSRRQARKCKGRLADARRPLKKLAVCPAQFEPGSGAAADGALFW
ncbi:serine/threonine protein kinase [Aliirhizobium terrae]|uniref:serine/threonine-protein kinase n=1 Tax=Terrirhizobium terrae TaxID=2926709 RepID=UPI002575A8BA|nr:serine/threonine-protein kinase [Rhizobium sp. CC-CFT758]WJH42156.1 serine/threonine protein kinase [Rhizobium sp. CC-CFT758]